MDYLDEISKIIDDHRAEVLVTCEASCWCWSISDAIRSYRLIVINSFLESVREEVTMSTKLICNVNHCGWRGTEDEVLKAPSPFDVDGDELWACPNCKTVNSLRSHNGTICMAERRASEQLEMFPLSKKPPPPPAPPLSRYLMEYGGCGICPKCGSTLKRTIIFFGKKKCIHPKCGYEI